MDLADTAPNWSISTESVDFIENSTANVDYDMSIDPGDSPIYSYSLSDVDASSFSIDSSANLSFLSPPDYETKNQYFVEIIATTLVGSTSKYLIVNIVDSADIAPTWNVTTETVNYTENDTAGVTYDTTIDSGDSAVTYSLAGTDASSFSINSTLGNLSFVSSPDYETKNQYSLQIVAQNPAGSSTKNLTIDIIDVADVAPTWNVTTETVNYTENDTADVTYDTTIDSGDSAVTYSLAGTDASSFSINSTLGNLSFVSSLITKLKTNTLYRS